MAVGSNSVMTRRDRSWRMPLPSREAGWLIAVAAIYFVLQIVLFNESRFLEWDEAIYLGVASDVFDSSRWAAHRSPGMLWLIRPYLVTATSLEGLRIYLALAATAIVGLGFSRWLRPAGILAPISMGLFGAGWLTLFYGSEASPNLYVAACAVGAAGALASYHRSQRLGDILLLSVFVAGATFLRLSDGLVVAAGIVAISFVLLSTRAAVSATASAIAGIAIGAIPWTVEAAARFGGPIARLRVASNMVESGLRWNITAHLRLIDGPIMGPDPTAANRIVLGLTVTLLLLGAAGLLMSKHRRSVGIAATLALTMAAPYLFYVGALAPRFLLPSYALWSIPVASGIVALWRIGATARAAIVIGAVLAVTWSISTAVRIENAQVEARSDAQTVGITITTAEQAEDCIILAQYGYPQIAIAAGCAGFRSTVEDLACVYRKTALGSKRYATTFVATIAQPTTKQLRYLTEVPSPESIAPWQVYRVQDGLERLCEQSP